MDGHVRRVLIVQLVLRVLFRLVLTLLFLVAVLMDIGIQEVLAQVIIYIYTILNIYIYIYIGCGWKFETCASASSCSTCIVQAGVNISLHCDCNDGFWDDGASCSSTYILIYILDCEWPCESCSDASTCVSCKEQIGMMTTLPCGCDTDNHFDEKPAEICTCEDGYNTSDNSCVCIIYIYIYIRYS